MSEESEARRATRLRSVLAMPEYEDTIGTYIKKAQEQALHELQTATLDSFQKAQGRYQAITELIDQIESVLKRGDVAQERLSKRKKELDQ